MTATIIQYAPNAHSASSAGERTCAAAHGDEGASAPSRSAHSIQAGIRVMIGHARLACAAAAGGDKDLERKLLKQQGEILMLAGLRLLDEVAP